MLFGMEHQVYIIKRESEIVYVGKHSCKGSSCPHNPASNPVCNYKGSGKALHHAYKKYGRAAFTKEIVAVEQSEAEALLIETELIHRLKSKGVKLYNILTEGTSWGLGRTVSDVTRRRMSESASKRVASQMTKDKLAKIASERVPYVRSEETREKTRQSLLGTKRTQTTKDKQRQALGAGYLIEGIKYHSFEHVAEHYPISMSSVRRRVLSDKYPEWRKL